MKEELAALDGRQGESTFERWRPRLAIVLAVILFLIGISAFIFFSRRDLGQHVVLATGTRGGVYNALGEIVAEILAGIPHVSVEARTTNGSSDNLHLLEQGEADFGFAQSDMPGNESLRIVARLYQELLQIVVRRDAPIQDVTDLEGLRVNLGPQGSGTHKLVSQILMHYGISESDLQAQFLDPADSVAAFRQGQLDAVVFLAGLSTPAVSELFVWMEDEIRLLELGEADMRASKDSALQGLERALPGTHATAIPAHTYGAYPREAVGTMAVDALLLTHTEMPERLVREVTRRLFESRFRLASHSSAASELEELDLATIRSLRLPLHRGAADYYARNEPPFIVAFAAPLSLGVSLVMGFGSLAFGLIELRRKNKKDRVDRYYLKVEKLGEKMNHATGNRERLWKIQQRLLDLRQEAIHDLVAEKLKPDEAFSILQRSLGSRLSEIQRLLAAPRAMTPSPGEDEPGPKLAAE